jgi:hypothetical protein
MAATLERLLYQYVDYQSWGVYMAGGVAPIGVKVRNMGCKPRGLQPHEFRTETDLV